MIIKKGKKFIAVALAAVIIAASSLSGTPVVKAEETVKTVDEIVAEQQALEEEQSQLQSQLDELAADEAKQVEYQETLEKQMTSVQDQITSANKDIKTLNSSIKELNKKVEASQAEYSEVLELFKERIKAIYKTGTVGTLEVLLSAESLSDYSIKAEVMKSISKHDSELMDQISDYLKSTQDEREELQKEKETIAQLKKTLESKTDELETLESENQQALSQISETKSAAEESLQQSYEDADALSGAMADAIAAMQAAQATPEPTPVPEESTTVEDDNGDNSDNGEETGDDNVESSTPEATPTPDSGSSSGIGFSWPCPGYSYISAGWMGYEGHRGLDMAAAYGTPIYAAAAGTVMMANSTDSWGDSWGYYVSIYHNPTYSTLYAHCSSLAVSTGEYVQQGQLIGYVGSTGNSTGYHLHFEVYENGTRVDPAQFF